MVISVCFQSELDNSVDPDQLASVKADFYLVYMGASSREKPVLGGLRTTQARTSLRIRAV